MKKCITCGNPAQPYNLDFILFDGPLHTYFCYNCYYWTPYVELQASVREAVIQDAFDWMYHGTGKDFL